MEYPFKEMLNERLKEVVRMIKNEKDEVKQQFLMGYYRGILNAGKLYEAYIESLEERKIEKTKAKSKA